MLILRRANEREIANHVDHILHFLRLKPLLFLNTVAYQIADRPNNLVGVVVNLKGSVVWFRANSISPNKNKCPNEVFELRLCVMLSQCAKVLLTTHWSGTY
jgi:hypothetical protein